MRSRASSTGAATRREVEQSIARFEKRLDDANDALKTLGSHLGRAAHGGYKEMSSALTSLRREAAKTNKQALKDFDKLRAALTEKAPAASRSNSGSKASSSASKKSSGSSRSSAKKTSSRSAAKRSTAKRSSAKRSTAKRATSKRSTGSTRSRKSS